MEPTTLTATLGITANSRLMWTDLSYSTWLKTKLLAQGMLLKLQDKLDCWVFWTFGCHHACRKRICHVSLFCLFLTFELIHGHHWLSLCWYWVLSLYATPECLHVLENVTRASTDQTVGRKCHFFVNYPLKGTDNVWLMTPVGNHFVSYSCLVPNSNVHIHKYI